MNKHIHIGYALHQKNRRKEAGTGDNSNAQLILAMKLTLMLIFIFSIQVSAMYSQQITLSVKNATLEEVMQQVKAQTGYSFFSDAKYLAQAKPVTISLDHAEITDALQVIFSEQPFGYQLRSKVITILPRTEASEKTLRASLQQQEFIIRGMVTDQAGKALPGVSIRAQNENRGTVTDQQGHYIIRLLNSTTLIYSFIGLKTEQRPVHATATVNVTLSAQQDELEEVVVLGYGEVAKKDLTGSVGQVNVSDLVKAPVASFEQALGGRIAGVQVVANDGQPGSAINIVVRGANSLTQENSPLYVIDGFPVENPDNAALNPQDIASINVLKDASSTAIYGARAANGVIIIETKKGQSGRAEIAYNGSAGFSRIIKKMDMMNPYEFVAYQVERSASTAAQHYFNEEEDTTLESYRNVEGMDWQDIVLQTAPMQIHNLAVRGGNSGTRYSVSGSIHNQEGILIHSGYDRYSGRLGLDQTVNKKLRIGTIVNYSYMQAYGQEASSIGTAGESSYPFFSIWGYRPVTRQSLENGDLNELLDQLLDPTVTVDNNFRINPKKSIEHEYRYRKTKALFANGYANYSFNNTVSYRISAGLTNQVVRTELFNNSQSRQGTPLFPSNIRGVNGSIADNGRFNWLMEQTVTYKNRFSDHSIDAVGGFTLQGQKNDRYGFAAQHVPNEELGISGLDEGTPYQSYASESIFNLASFLGRLNYNYRSAYLFTATFRMDGSSKFAPENHWSFFPSAAFAWRMSEEPFLRDMDFISDAKLRLSYGLTGNNRVSDFAYLPTLGLPISTSYSFGNGVPGKGVIPVILGNPGLKWESTSQFDAGYDLALFKDRVNLTVDIYQKITEDLLLNANLPYSSGFQSAFRNVGSIKNQGLEITLNTKNVQNRDFRWESDINISFNRNQVTQIVENENTMLTIMPFGPSFNNTPLYIAKTGEPAARFYGLIWDGVYQVSDFDQSPSGAYTLKPGVPDNGNPRESIRPGDIRYLDINADGHVTAADRTLIGNPLPHHIGGFNNNFYYKNFSLNLFFQWSYGNQLYNANRLIFEGNALNHILLNQFASYVNRWTPDNPSETLFRTGGQGPVGAHSSRVIEDGSFLRLKTFSLAYTLPETFTKRLGIKSLALQTSVQNLITWTNYSGMDPEVAVRNSTLTPGFDYSAYPHARSVVFGINASL